MVAEQQIGDRAAGLNGGEIGVGRHRWVKKDTRVERGSGRAVRLTMRSQIDILEKNELLIDSQAGGVLQDAEVEKRRQHRGV